MRLYQVQNLKNRRIVYVVDINEAKAHDYAMMIGAGEPEDLITVDVTDEERKNSNDEPRVRESLEILLRNSERGRIAKFDDHETDADQRPSFEKPKIWKIAQPDHMKIYSISCVRGKNDAIWVVAPNQEIARGFALTRGMSNKRENLKAKDVTSDMLHEADGKELRAILARKKIGQIGIECVTMGNEKMSFSNMLAGNKPAYARKWKLWT